MSLPDHNDYMGHHSFPHIPSIRDASRQLVRELGFMRNTLAGTSYSPSAVHAIIEIGDRDACNATTLCQTLNLEKSSISRMLRKLIENGEVVEKSSGRDAREKRLSLTPRGLATLAEINDFAQAQVTSALTRAPPNSERKILDGLQTYATALRDTRMAPPPYLAPMAPQNPRIVSGYQPGVIARCVHLHMLYYPQVVGFGLSFESSLLRDLGEFISRIDSPLNEIWAAMDGDEIIGCLCIDGQAMGGGVAHLRVFIVDEKYRGAGVGRRLLSHAMEFVDKQGFEETHLWTFRGLDAAFKLYGECGFVLIEEELSGRWGEEVIAQRLVRRGLLSGT